MLVEREGSPQNDLDSLRGHLPVGSPIRILILLGDTCYIVGSPIMISILVGTLASWVPYYDLDSFR